jgi:hypothetical protein
MPLLNGPNDVFAPRGAGLLRLKTVLIVMLGICLGAFSALLLIHLFGVRLDRAPAWAGALLLVPVAIGVAAGLLLVRRSHKGKRP